MAGNVSPEGVTLASLKEEIHAVLCSVKGAVPAEQLLKDYNSLCGSTIPFRQLGFGNLSDLLKSIPDVVSCNHANGTLFVRVVPKNETAHINKLVQGQKAAKKTSRMSFTPYNQRDNFQQLGRSKPLLKNPVHPNNLNKNGTQHGAAPWNVPNHYQPPAMRSLAVVPPQSTVRQVLLPRSSEASSQPVKEQNKSSQPPPPSLPKTAVQSKPAQLQLQIPSSTSQAAKQSKPPVPHLPIVSSNNFYREKLKRFVHCQQLGEISYEEMKLKNGKYVATVVIDKKKISCYPDQFSAVDDAYEKAAEVAFQELESKYQDDLKKMRVTTDNDLLAKRVIDVVSKYSAGCWSDAFFKFYSDDYGECLPEDWVERVKSVTDEVEFTAIQENFLVCKALKNIVGKTDSPVPEQPKVPFNESVSDLLLQPDPKRLESHNTRSVSNEPIRPVAPQYATSSFWVVHVLVVFAGDQLAVRRIDSEQYTQWEELMNDMDLYYSEHVGSLKPVDHLEPGRLYAAPIDGLWARVELVSLTNDGLAILSLVDYADTEAVKMSSIYSLEARFGELPCQGMTCHLHGLSSFASSEVAVNAEIQRLLNSQFIAHVISREPQLSVILYEQSSGRELNMNEWILDQVAEQAPSLPLKVGPVIQNSVISYVSSACDVYMLRDTVQQNAVYALVSLVALRAEDSPVPACLTANSIYLGRSDKHGWCRMRLYSNIPTHDGNVSVQLMDFGDTELVPGNTLRDLKPLSPVLALMPDQAIRVLLARVPPSPSKVFTDKAAKTLRQIAPPELSLMVRVLEINNGVPVVELFERLDSGKLVTINASLEMDESLYRSADQAVIPPSVLPKARIDAEMSQRVAAMTLPSRRSSTSSSPSPTLQMMESVAIPDADIPPVDSGRFLKPFDVRVFNVSNPDHFYVQSLQSLQQLSSLMHRLKEACNRDDVKTAKIDYASLVIGSFYAAWHQKTESFRRIKITGKSGGTVCVHFIDHGETDLIAASCIRPLPIEFSELPAQAIKAKLFGVKPSDGDWSPQNALFFKKFVDDKVFASYVMGVFPDRTLHLQLIDISNMQEVVVSKYLMDNCHAMSA